MKRIVQALGAIVLPASVIYMAHPSETVWWHWTIMLLLLVMTTASFLFYYRYQKIKASVQQHKEAAFLEARLLVEKETGKALRMAEEKRRQAAQQALEIIEKAKEEARQLQAQVTTTTVMLANKTDYLMQLQEKLQSTGNQEHKRLAKEIKTNFTETDHWSEFLKNFNLLHSNYVDNIIKKHPELTTHEVKLVCFIVSGLSNKEIAGIFSVEPESIKKARYRLKKKLNLPEEENLTYYLHNLR